MKASEDLLAQTQDQLKKATQQGDKGMKSDFFTKSIQQSSSIVFCWYGIIDKIKALNSELNKLKKISNESKNKVEKLQEEVKNQYLNHEEEIEDYRLLIKTDLKQYNAPADFFKDLETNPIYYRLFSKILSFDFLNKHTDMEK